MTIQIIKVEQSPRQFKKYRVYLNNNKFFDFGLEGSETYLDHKDPVKKENYLKRHMANKIEYELIKNLIPSPSLFSAYLLWNTPDLQENIKKLNTAFKNK